MRLIQQCQKAVQASGRGEEQRRPKQCPAGVGGVVPPSGPIPEVFNNLELDINTRPPQKQCFWGNWLRVSVQTPVVVFLDRATIVAPSGMEAVRGPCWGRSGTAVRSIITMNNATETAAEAGLVPARRSGRVPGAFLLDAIHWAVGRQ